MVIKISCKYIKDNAFDISLTYIGKKQKLNLSTLMYYKDAVINELYKFAKSLAKAIILSVIF